MSHDRATSLELRSSGRRSASAAPPGRGASRLRGLVERLEIQAAERALARLDPAQLLDPGVLEAEMMIAVGGCDITRALAVCDRITAAGRWTDVLTARPSVGGFAVAAHIYAARVASAEDLADRIPPGFEWEVARCWLGLAIDVDGLQIPARKGSPLDALIVRLRVARGELGQVRGPLQNPWAQAASGLGMTSLRANREIGDGPGRYEPHVLRPLFRSGRSAEVGDTAGARVLLDHAMEEAREVGSPMLQATALLAAVSLSLTYERDPDRATSELNQLAGVPGALDLAFVVEEARMWRGAVHLMCGRPEQAVDELRRTIDDMDRGDRPRELSRALIFLSEAAWRAGDEDASDAAAERALEVSVLQDSTTMILRALVAFPAVLARRIDAERLQESSWHRFGRAILHRGSSEVALAPAGHLSEFGRLELTAGGESVRPRLAKSAELLAFLAAQPGQRATRDEILQHLWGETGGDAARTYLRQAVSRLRGELPDGITVERGEGGDGLRLGAFISSESRTLDELVVAAGRSQTSRRERFLRDALRLAGRGEYLAGCTSQWADARRDRYRAVAIGLHLDLAEMEFEMGRYHEAWRRLEVVVGHDAASERACRLQMQTARMLGDEDQVVASYRRCRAALVAIGLEPSRATRELAQTLRS